MYVYVILPFVAGLALILCEVFVPGGILGLAGAACIVTSIAMAFWHFPEHAWYILLGELVATSILVVPVIRFALKRFSLKATQQAAAGFTSTFEDFTQLIGQQGTAVTTLRPAGIISVGGKRINAVTDGEFIQKGDGVVVCEVEGSRVVVRQSETAQDGSVRR